MGWGGKREGAGRKPFLEHKTGSEIVSLSAEIALKALRGELKLEPWQLADLAKQFVLKAMPSHIEAEGFQGNQIVHIVRNDRAVAEEKATPLLPR